MQAYQRLLMDLGPQNNPHMKRRFVRHAQGTHDLLKAWGNSADVCVAGLFHRVYGTVGYEPKSARHNQRERVADATGARVENLVYLFYASDRRQLFSEIESAEPCLLDRFTSTARPVSHDTLAALIEIEVASYLEQHSPYTANAFVIRYMRRLLTESSARMSAQARDALERFLRRSDAPLARLLRLPKGMAWKMRVAMRQGTPHSR